MYEYKVDTCTVRNAEDEMNTYAKDGWRVISVSPNAALGYGVIVTYEREIKEEQ